MDTVGSLTAGRCGPGRYAGRDDWTGPAVGGAGQQASISTLQALLAVYAAWKARPPMEPSCRRPSGVVVFQAIGAGWRWTGGLPPLQPLPSLMTAIRIASSAAARESGRVGAMAGVAAA